MGISIKGLPANTKLVLGAKHPKALSENTSQNNGQSWATIQAALAKGPQTYGGLQTLLKEKHNHANFVGYAVKNGWLAIK